VSEDQGAPYADDAQQKCGDEVIEGAHDRPLQVRSPSSSIIVIRAGHSRRRRRAVALHQRDARLREEVDEFLSELPPARRVWL
jgi:hypothetical protein